MRALHCHRLNPTVEDEDVELRMQEASIRMRHHHNDKVTWLGYSLERKHQSPTYDHFKQGESLLNAETETERGQYQCESRPEYVNFEAVSSCVVGWGHPLPRLAGG